MAEQHVAVVETNEADLAALTALRTGLALAVLKLFKSSFVPTPESVDTDFDAAEADYTGYASVAQTWSAIGVDAVGDYVSMSTRSFFQATADTVDNEIGGGWLETAGGDVVFYFVLTTPVQMGTALNFMGVVFRLVNPITQTDVDVDY
jgi:hypothetical protein